MTIEVGGAVRVVGLFLYGSSREICASQRVRAPWVRKDMRQCFGRGSGGRNQVWARDLVHDPAWLKAGLTIYLINRP